MKPDPGILTTYGTPHLGIPALARRVASAFTLSRASIAYALLTLGWLLLCVSAHLVWSWPASLGLAGVGALAVGGVLLWVATEPDRAGEA